MTLRVLTFNTASFNDGPMWYSSHFDEGAQQPLFDFRDKHKQHVRDMIYENAPDVVCLQESVLVPPRRAHRRLVVSVDGVNGAASFSSDVSESDDDDADDDDDDDEVQQPPPFKLEASAAATSVKRDLFEVGGSTTDDHNKQPEKNAADVLPGYEYLGRTETHANFVVLFVRKDFDGPLPAPSLQQQQQQPPRTSIVRELVRGIGVRSAASTDRPGSRNNFPLCVLRLKDGSLVAIASVHFTPFGSPLPWTKESRRELQLRKTTDGLYRALRAAAAAATTPITKKVRGAVMIVGDTNMRSETHAASELKLIDVHDFLRGDNCSDPPMYTWDTFKNRFNGGGDPFLARFDRVYLKSSGEDDDESPSWLVPTSLRLIADEPIVDSELDRIDSETFKKYKAKRVAELTREVNAKKQQSQQNDAEEGGSAGGSWLFDGEQPPKNLGLKLEFDAWALEEAQNEHAGPVPPGGRKRYLSDHFGLCCDLVAL